MADHPSAFAIAADSILVSEAFNSAGSAFSWGVSVRDGRRGFRHALRGRFLARPTARMAKGGTFQWAVFTHQNPFGGRRTLFGLGFWMRAGSFACCRLSWRPAPASG